MNKLEHYLTFSAAWLVVMLAATYVFLGATWAGMIMAVGMSVATAILTGYAWWWHYGRNGDDE